MVEVGFIRFIHIIEGLMLNPLIMNNDLLLLLVNNSQGQLKLGNLTILGPNQGLNINSMSLQPLGLDCQCKHPIL